MKTRICTIGLLVVLALVLVPAVAMAAPAITQGVQGVVKDASTGVAIPFARVSVQVGAGPVAYFTTEYDGTYSYATVASDDIHMTASAGSRVTQLASVVVDEGLPTTQDFSLIRFSEFDQPVYRFFNMKGGVHFYTADDAEFINTYKNLSSVFHYDGIAYFVPWGDSEDPDAINPNTVPLYRFFNRRTGVHFYTASEAEKANVIATRSDDYTYEGIAYNVSDHPATFTAVAGVAAETGVALGRRLSLPIYRFYVPLRDAHFFTADSGEIFGPQNSGLSNYYHYEGIGFYINGWEFTNPG